MSGGREECRSGWGLWAPSRQRMALAETNFIQISVHPMHCIAGPTRIAQRTERALALCVRSFSSLTLRLARLEANQKICILFGPNERSAARDLWSCKCSTFRKEQVLDEQFRTNCFLIRLEASSVPKISKLWNANLWICGWRPAKVRYSRLESLFQIKISIKTPRASALFCQTWTRPN